MASKRKIDDSTISTGSKSKRLCLFKPDFTTKWPFIVKGKEAVQARCTLCNTDFNIGHQGKADIERHIAAFYVLFCAPFVFVQHFWWLSLIFMKNVPLFKNLGLASLYLADSLGKLIQEASRDPHFLQNMRNETRSGSTSADDECQGRVGSSYYGKKL